MKDENPIFIHIVGIALFLFIPLVLFLFVRFPFGILPSFGLAIFLMFSHRFIAIPFMNRYRIARCFWCGKTSSPRANLTVEAGKPIEFQLCGNTCLSPAKRFFDFCTRNRLFLRLGIFAPLSWYIITMILMGFGKFVIPVEWNRFIFRFLIAITVASVSFLYRRGNETQQPSFPFPIHNLFLLGGRNTLLVFRLVGLWWIAACLWFLWKKF